MNNIDTILDLQIEIIQISIYCDIVKKLLLKYRSISIIKIVTFSYIVKKRQHLQGSIFNGKNKKDLVLKFLSQVNGLFDELCEQMPYVLESIDLLTKDGFCEVHEGEVICITNSNQIISDFDAFTEAAFQESKSYSDRQFLREVISIV